MMILGTKPFILNTQRFRKFATSDAIIYLSEFNKDSYCDSMFKRLGVHFPHRLNNAVDKRKAEFLTGRYCASKALQEIGVKNYTVSADEHRCPLWPEHVAGSISHSHNIAVAAVAFKTTIFGIGIDIEKILSAEMVNGIKEQVLFGHESGLLDIDYISNEIMVSLIFSIKESFFKAAYPSTGHYFGFDAVSIDYLDFTSNIFRLTLLQDLNKLLRKGATYAGKFTFLNGHVFSILTIQKQS
ncbi:4'-phosphopantetheinyl transferase family protein [Photobacterium lutimaris]|uniref:Enterobactin synthase component D n=1 Tax=Photobacterium lutimaris TaxID=388278 RepID=A0A2T3J2G8_9GAMM|nr:4'-phosphopantetheinyl transferase superfamily protein [Photobacterium lutimaris]PSU35489.1 hypothetical protein C9I99_00245 [Photobacterium lutimaris]TDR78534.1 4'-phosphopantetheinyl transferase EntD [Photobacterium lutimaris]